MINSCSHNKKTILQGDHSSSGSVKYLNITMSLLSPLWQLSMAVITV